MKTTIYDLLGMIKDGKAPKKIIFKETPFEYELEEKDYYFSNGLNKVTWLFDEYVITDILNDEVEILETAITYNQYNKQDKIEKLEITQEKNCKNNWKWKLNGYNISTPQKIMGDKINEIIDRLNNV